MIELLMAVILSSLPILYAATGELVVEKSGILNLGVEGMMLMGAVIASITVIVTGNPYLAIITGALSGVITSFIFGFFKGYVVSICLFSIFNWFYPYQNWGISAEDAISFNIINRGSEILIEEFPSSEDFIDTKEKIENI